MRSHQASAYTLEYKLEAVRLVKAGQSVAVVAKVLGIPSSSISNWIRLDLAMAGELDVRGSGGQCQLVL